MNIKANKVFLCVIILFLITLLFPVFKQIPKLPGEGFYYILIPVLFFLIYPQIFKTSIFKFLSILLIFHLFYFLAGIYPKNQLGYRSIYSLFEMVFIPVSLYIYSTKKLNDIENKNIFNVIIILMTLTLISTQLALLIFPNIARDLSSKSFDIDQRRLFSMYNISSYGLLFNYALLAPVFLIIAKIKKRVLFLLVFLLTATVLFYAQLFGALLIFVINLFGFLVIRQFKIKTIKLYILMLCSTTIVSFLFIQTIALILTYIASYFEGFSQISIKINELIQLLIYNDFNVESNLSAYEIKKMQSLNEFSKSPFFGGGISGGHHFWYDNLAKFGYLGTLPFILSFFYVFKIVKNQFANPYLKVLYFHFTIIFILIGITKNIILTMPVTIFFIIPFLLKYIDKNYLNRNTSI